MKPKQFFIFMLKIVITYDILYKNTKFGKTIDKTLKFFDVCEKLMYRE